MKIEEAIQVLEQQTRYLESLNSLEQVKAHRLGIEALKAWREHRGTGSLMNPLLLPSETKD